MKKILDVIVLMAIAIFLIILFQSSVQAGSRRGRTLEHHNSVIPFATLVPNNQRGYDYFVNGSRVGHSRKNNMGSYDVFIRGRKKYSGLRFRNSGVHNFYGYNTSPKGYRHRVPGYNRGSKSSGAMSWGQRQAWTAKRESAHSHRQTTWSHLMPGLFE